MAKRNWGTRLTDVSLVIGLGPGFRTGIDVHLVVETNNNENLGKVILSVYGKQIMKIKIIIELGFLMMIPFRKPQPGDGEVEVEKG